jgi:hypothetical protein
MVENKTADQLRAEIDAGRTGDKVPAFDPAAAPLGTDEEAAGTPIPQAAINQAHAQETSATARMPSGQGAQPDKTEPSAPLRPQADFAPPGPSLSRITPAPARSKSR